MQNVDITQVEKSISFYVLMQDEALKQAVNMNDEETIIEALYQLGIDTSKPYEYVSCEHRPIPSKPFIWNGPRIEGFERLDKEWVKSGYASLDAIIASDDDPSKRYMLRSMRAERNSESIFDSKD